MTSRGKIKEQQHLEQCLEVNILNYYFDDDGYNNLVYINLYLSNLY